MVSVLCLTACGDDFPEVHDQYPLELSVTSTAVQYHDYPTAPAYQFVYSIPKDSIDPLYLGEFLNVTKAQGFQVWDDSLSVSEGDSFYYIPNVCMDDQCDDVYREITVSADSVDGSVYYFYYGPYTLTVRLSIKYDYSPEYKVEHF